jgi:hypothetical protein
MKRSLRREPFPVAGPFECNWDSSIRVAIGSPRPACLSGGRLTSSSILFSGLLGLVVALSLPSVRLVFVTILNGKGDSLMGTDGNCPSVAVHTRQIRHR